GGVRARALRAGRGAHHVASATLVAGLPRDRAVDALGLRLRRAHAVLAHLVRPRRPPRGCFAAAQLVGDDDRHAQPVADPDRARARIALRPLGLELFAHGDRLSAALGRAVLRHRALHADSQARPPLEKRQGLPAGEALASNSLPKFYAFAPPVACVGRGASHAEGFGNGITGVVAFFPGGTMSGTLCDTAGIVFK